MHPPDPTRHGGAAEEALAAEDKRGRIVLPHALVWKKERVGPFRFEKGAEGGKAFARWGREDVVGVHPEEIVARRLGKGKVAGGRKVVPPGEIVDESAEGECDLPRAVNRARIDDDDLVKKLPNAFQTAFKDGFFVFYDHAEGKGTHMPPRPHFMRHFAIFATILREIAVLYYALYYANASKPQFYVRHSIRFLPFPNKIAPRSSRLTFYARSAIMEP